MSFQNLTNLKKIHEYFNDHELVYKYVFFFKLDCTFFFHNFISTFLSFKNLLNYGLLLQSRVSLDLVDKLLPQEM